MEHEARKQASAVLPRATGHPSHPRLCAPCARTNPGIPPGKCVVVGTSEGLHATARPLADPV
ncbi:hypothetical protein HaLaN_04472 [Haematococcus lacustris]|uniref:Uncharacterized protein n=1 Tax=Haematococcus lacustris TaxID=44745 RepID=A0A699Z1U5_HAELA|nr:hypothetical protein HaLaN_04472 [Haematococcus lacustris]